MPYIPEHHYPKTLLNICINTDKQFNIRDHPDFPREKCE